MVDGPDAKVAHDILRSRMVRTRDPEVETLQPEPARFGSEVEFDHLVRFSKPTRQLVPCAQSGRASYSPCITPR